MTLTSVCTNLVSSLNLPINRPGSGGRLDILLLGINRRFTETEMGSFDNGNAHTGIDISANFAVTHSTVSIIKCALERQR